MQCPYCGSSSLTETFNFNEHACDRCGCEFKFDDGYYRVFVEGNYEKFCESVLLEMTNSTNVNVGNVLVQVIRECKKYGPEQLDVMVEHIKNVAENVLSETSIGWRDNYDFGALVEGVDAFETLGKTLMEREDLELNLHGFKRYLEDNDFRDMLAESAALEEEKDKNDIYDNHLEKRGEHGKQGYKHEEATDYEDEDDYDAEDYSGKAASKKSDKSFSKSDRKYKQRGSSKPKGKKPPRGKNPNKQMEEDFDREINPVTGEKWEDLNEADMTDKDPDGAQDWDGSELPGDGVKTNRADAEGAPHLEEENDVGEPEGADAREWENPDDATDHDDEDDDTADVEQMEESVSLETSVRSLLESKTLSQVAKETDINEQLVIEAAALGKTLAELFEADMAEKRGVPDDVDKDKWERCVKDVKKDDDVDNPYAVCNAQLSESGEERTPEERKIIDKAVQDIHTDKLQVQDVLPKVPEHLRDDVLAKLRKNPDFDEPEGADAREWENPDDATDHDDEDDDTAKGEGGNNVNESRNLKKAAKELEEALGDYELKDL